ncbi:MAG: DJ-1/PfpI family protein [Oscillospiraceae bacterium]|nr:DJ-1/PfpI family protein [Oscillospiraceae bacterium]
MIAVFLANGFEEMEALATVDILRRAQCDVKTVAVGTADNRVTGSHSITVEADLRENALVLEELEAVVLPGGMPGTLNLDASETVQAALAHCIQSGKVTAAICAAPSVLGKKGYLNGKHATVYPGFETELEGATLEPEVLVVKDGTIITGKGPAAAIDFGLKLVETLCGKEQAEAVGMAMQCRQ